MPGGGTKIGEPVSIEQAGGAAVAGVSARPAAAAANGRPKQEAGAGSRAGAGPARGGARAGGGKDMGPLFPIEGLSPYQNK